MTALEKQEANERKEIYHIKARGKCFYCGKSISLSQCHLAHRIPKGYIKRFGESVIHHPFNLRVTCDKCNIKALIDPKTHRIEASVLVDAINEDLRGE